jgi:hypothetical protein
MGDRRYRAELGKEVDEQRAVLLKQELVLRWDPISARAAEEAIKKINE